MAARRLLGAPVAVLGALSLACAGERSTAPRLTSPSFSLQAPPSQFNGGAGFVVFSGAASGPARFIFVTEQGTVLGWNPSVALTHAIVAVDNSAGGAVYKGLAIAGTAAGDRLYAANFRAATVDVFDA